MIVLARRIHSVQGALMASWLLRLAEDFLTLLQSVRYTPDMLAGWPPRQWPAFLSLPAHGRCLSRRK